MDWSANLTFKEFAYFCDKCSQQEDIGKRHRFLIRFLHSCRDRMGSGDGDSLYPVMRLMLPDLDKARGDYRIKESVVATLYINMLQLGTNSPEANRLKNYIAPKTNFEGAGDVASVLFEVLESRAYTGDSVTVADINNHLNNIVSTNETEGRSGVTEVLQKLNLKIDAVQHKWVLRIILKDMKKLRLDQSNILAKMHPDAKEYFEVNANLLQMCQKLKDPNKRIKEAGNYLGEEKVSEETAGRKWRSGGGKVAEIYRQQENLDSVIVSSHSLKDKVVVVEPVHLDKKRRIEKLVVRHGGKVEQNVKAGKTDLYIACGMTVKGQSVVASESVDVVTSNWALEQEDVNILRMPQPHQYIWWTEKTARDWADRSDQFLDPLTVPATRDSIKFSRDKVDEMDRADQISQTDKASFEIELGLGSSQEINEEKNK